MKSRKKEYDRLRAQRIYADFIERRVRLISAFGGKCQDCGEEEDRQRLHFHHVIYHPIESNYPRKCSSFHLRQKRLNEAELNPERFQLLCVICHSKARFGKTVSVSEGA